MSPVTTLLKMLPRARKEAASTAPVVSVSSTTSESLIDTCERIMPDHNPGPAIGGGVVAAW
jgi:hypothetical protein